ncbi:MAG: TolC family protein [Gammaproteobacteria bacterium]
MRYILFRSRVFLSLITAALLLASGNPPYAQTDALTFDAALRLAADRSQQLVAEDAAANAAREMAVAAHQAPDPTLTTGVNNLPINGADAFSLGRDFMTMRSIGVGRELTRDDKREARAARFVSEADEAQAARTVALTELQRGAASAWLDRYYRERARDILLRQRDEAALQIEAADVAFRSGHGPQSDVFAARLALAKIEDRIAVNARDIEVATTRLARWVGDSARHPLGPPPATGNVALRAGDLETTLAHHPEVALMTKQEAVARADVEVARTNKRSDWTVEVMYSQRGPGFSNMMSVNFSKPLQWRQRNRQDREIAAKLSLVERARAEREEATREHVADASASLASWRVDRERLGRYASTLIPLAGERTAAAAAAYRGGKGTLGAVLEARVAEVDIHLDELMLEMETATLWAELTFLVPSGAAHE